MLEELMSEDSTETITPIYIANQIAKIRYYSDLGQTEQIIDNAKYRIASHASLTSSDPLTEQEKEAVDQLIQEFKEKFPELIDQQLLLLNRRTS
jgi:hypothetical protein